MARFHSPSNLINYFFLVLVSFFIISSYAQDIEEVIVEAERQEANTLDVTESLDIFDLEDLEVYRITGLNDVANNVPGLTASPSGSQGLRFTLRGIGARDSQLGVESKIGLYVDGAFLGRASGLVFDIVDLEMVEVAKGPQGFRFGRHAIGGNINLITAKANVEDFSARGEVTLGNYDRETYKATLNLPVNDQFAVRASAFTNKRDGWVENTGNGVDWGGFDREGFKIAARWYATDDLIIDYSYDQADFITQPVYYQPEYYGEGNCTTNDIAITNIAMYNLTNSSPCRDSEIILTPLGEGRRDSDESTILDIENSTTEADGHSLIFDWAFSENHNLKFISTYRTSQVNNTFYFFPNTTTADTAAGVPLISQAITQLYSTELLALRGNFFSNRSWYEAYGFQNIGQIALAQQAGTPQSIQFAQDLFDAAIALDNARDGLPANSNGQYLAMDPCQIHPVQCADRQARLNNLDPADDPVSYAMFFLGYGAITGLQTSPLGLEYAVTNQFNSIFASPQGGLASLDNHKQKSFELRLSGSFKDERLKYSTGLYYFGEKTGNGPGTAPPGYLYADLVELLDFGAINYTPESEDDFGFSYISKNRLGTDSYALYGSIDFRPLFLDERMEITLGFRYSEDARTLERQKLQAIGLIDRGSLDLEADTWYSFDPMFKVAYDLTYDFTGYFSVTSGYRPGNYNVDARDIPDNANNSQVGGAEEQESRQSADIVFDTESMIAYEFGGKGTLLDGLLDLEFATYYYDVKDGQETVIFPYSPVSRAVVNADGYAFGVELDTTWNLTDELSMTINYAHLRSGSDSYTTPFLTDYGRELNFFPPPNATAEQLAQAAEDAVLARDLAIQCRGGLRKLDLRQGRCEERKANFGAPVNSWQIGLDYTLPTEHFGELFFHLGYNYKESHYVNDTLTVDDRNLWDARISTALDQDWGTLKIALWGQNIFDNEYQVQKFELHRTVFDIASYGDPQMFGIDIIGEWY